MNDLVSALTRDAIVAATPPILDSLLPSERAVEIATQNGWKLIGHIAAFERDGERSIITIAPSNDDADIPQITTVRLRLGNRLVSHPMARALPGSGNTQVSLVCDGPMTIQEISANS